MEPLSLPDRVVAVLYWKLREQGLGSLAQRAVDLQKLVDQHPHGPAVGHDVMQGEDEEMLASGQPEEARSHQRSVHEIEGAPDLGNRQVTGLFVTLFGWPIAEVDQGQLEVPMRRHTLDRRVVFGRKRGSQHLVTEHDPGEALAKPVRVQRSDERKA